MFTNLNFSDDFLKAVAAVSNSDINLPDDLKKEIPGVIEKLKTVSILEDRKRLIQESFNKFDKGYDDATRISFENEISNRLK